MSVDIDYTTLAGLVWDATGEKAGEGGLAKAPTLTPDEFDAILQQFGIRPVRIGQAGRADWIIARNTHRQKLNEWLRQMHGVTLEVVGHQSEGRKVYGLIRSRDTLINKPFRIGSSFYNQIEHHLNAIARMVDPKSSILPPEGLDAAKLERYNALNRRRIERLVAEYYDAIEMHTLQAGFEVPDLPEKIVNLREHKGRRRGRK